MVSPRRRRRARTRCRGPAPIRVPGPGRTTSRWRRTASNWACTHPCTSSSGSRGCSSPCSSTAESDSACSPPGPTQSPATCPAYPTRAPRSRGPRRSTLTINKKAGRPQRQPPRAYRRSCTAGGRSQSRWGVPPPTSSVPRVHNRIHLVSIAKKGPSRRPSPRCRRLHPRARAPRSPRRRSPVSAACPPGTACTPTCYCRSGRRRAPLSGTVATAGTPPRRTRTVPW